MKRSSIIPTFSALAMIAVTFLLSYLSWRYVERPIRSNREMTERMFLLYRRWAGSSWQTWTLWYYDWWI